MRVSLSQYDSWKSSSTGTIQTASPSKSQNFSEILFARTPGLRLVLPTLTQVGFVVFILLNTPVERRDDSQHPEWESVGEEYDLPLGISSGDQLAKLYHQNLTKFALGNRLF